MKTLLITTVICLVAPAAALAESCSKYSSSHTAALLELYTSEGCSSCPPADKFVSSLRGAAGLTPDRLVPLSLHVDYWDYIGWNDRFAKHAFTERQRRLSDLAKTKLVYTPEVFVSGKELRSWQSDLPAAVRQINARPAQADIGIRLGGASGSRVPVEVSAHASQRSQLFVALFENSLSSEVKAGENRGVTLHHDYVVRDLIGPIDLPADAKRGKAAFSQTLSLPPGAVSKNLGIAAFVQSVQGEVLQALALPLCETSVR